MKKWLLAVFCLFAPVCLGQSAQPILQPHQTFVDGSGNPCSGCRLYSYAAGTTTPQATFTDASGSTPNTNPVILDASGSAAIWMGSNSYKFSLHDTFGTTLWTVDQVTATFPITGGPFLPLAGGTMSGSINLGTFNLLNVGNIGVGTSSPAWSIDVENGAINASEGYLYAGAAPLNHILLGNSTYYVDSATFPYGSLSGTPTLYYQTLQAATVAKPQEPVANYSAAFVLSDNSGVATNIDLATLDTAGTCTYCSFSYDIYGRVLSVVSNGIPGGTTLTGTGSGCGFSSDGNGLSCSTTVTLTSAMPDTSYSAVCSPNFSNAIATTTSAMPSMGLNWSVTSTNTISVVEALNNGSSTGYGISSTYGVTVYCIAHHT